jgi:hypothetical protein
VQLVQPGQQVQLVQQVRKELIFTLLGLLQTLARYQLVQLTMMLTLLMQMETYTFGAEALGLMQVRLLDRKGLRVQLEQHLQ